jgi:hypothetical protein
MIEIIYWSCFSIQINYWSLKSSVKKCKRFYILAANCERRLAAWCNPVWNTFGFSIRKDYWSLAHEQQSFNPTARCFSIRKDYRSLAHPRKRGLWIYSRFQYPKRLLVTCTLITLLLIFAHLFQYPKRLLVALVSICISPRCRINLRFTHYFDFNVKIAKASLALSI